MNYRTISFFDLDHTLLKVNASFQFGTYLFRNFSITPRKSLYLVGSYILHRWGCITPEQLNNLACNSLFSNQFIHDIEKNVQQFLDEQLNELLYYPVTNQLINAFDEGHYTVILSSSPNFIVKPIAERLGVDEWASTQYAVDSEGRISHVETHMDGIFKAFYVNDLCQKLQIPVQNTIAYSDSMQDINFLRTAGKAIGVNPDRKLKKYCLANNWEIL